MVPQAQDLRPADMTPVPESTEPPAAPAKRPPARRNWATDLEASLRQLIETVSAVLVLRGDDYPGQILEENAGRLAAAYVKLAKKNKAVRRFLEALTTSSEYGEVAMVTLSTLAPIAVYYGWVPGGMPLFGAAPPPSPEVRDHAAAPAPPPVGFPFVPAEPAVPDEGTGDTPPSEPGGPGEVPMGEASDPETIREARKPADDGSSSAGGP